MACMPRLCGYNPQPGQRILRFCISAAHDSTGSDDCSNRDDVDTTLVMDETPNKDSKSKTSSWFSAVDLPVRPVGDLVYPPVHSPAISILRSTSTPTRIHGDSSSEDAVTATGIRAPPNSPVLSFAASAIADPVDVGPKSVGATSSSSRFPRLDSIKTDVAPESPAVHEDINRPGLGASIWATTPAVREPCPEVTPIVDEDTARAGLEASM
ncbi:hypothetical protein DFH09DRAFT_1353971 [Mycena vulgaris]|nr:hypothetical protein DFH09DRAFT_1353971 [Mycena vulgaris]